MKDLLSTLLAISDAIRFLLRMQRVTIATASPLTVTLRDGTTVAAVAVTGLSYTTGSAGVALLAERGQPLVFPTT